MDTGLVRIAAVDLDATWIGQQMIAGTTCGSLSDIDHDKRGNVSALYVGGSRVLVKRSDVVIYDALALR